MKEKTVTIKDIARASGVSKSTVSRVLCGRNDVHPDTKQNVLAIAREMNYEPNSLALNLKHQKTNTIGVIVPETINRFFAQAIGGIQTRAEMAGMNVMICQSNESRIIEKKNLQSLLASHVDGLVVSISHETDNSDHFSVLQQKGIPLVFFDRICEDIEASHISTNNYEIAMQGTEHLIEQGCKRIAFVTGPVHLSNSKMRLKGYKDALAKHVLERQESYLIHSAYRSENVEEYTRFLINLPQRPDAIFAINDMAAVEMLYVLKKCGLRVPHDIAILGFNNDLVGEFIEPSLSTIEHPAFEIGIAAAEVVINHIRHPELKTEKRIINSRLIVRNSTRKISN